MILLGPSIKWLKIVEPYNKRTEIVTPENKKLTYGSSYCGYDVRVEFDEDGIVPLIGMAKGSFVLASTIEKFKMPQGVKGVVHDKSSWARRGIAVQNTVLEPGWEGYLTLELSNHSEGLDIYRGSPIAQVIFETTSQFPIWKSIVCFILDKLFAPKIMVKYKGKYQYQGRGPQEAR